MLEDDTTLGRGIQLALQDPDVTIALTGTLSQARKCWRRRNLTC